MEKIIVLASWVVSEGPNVVAAVVGVLSALIALFMMIPGEQPEKTLQKIVDVLAKYSKK